MSAEKTNREVEIIRTIHGYLDNGNEYYEVEIRIPADLVYFCGHFVGNPVLPGVVQLNSIAMAQIESLWPDIGRLEKLRRLKFIHIIRPNDLLRLRLERKKEKSQINMMILRDETCCTSAMLIFGELEKQ